MKIGIVGLPNVGKSTLFNALTKSYAADAQNFPFCTIEPNVGIVNVNDERLEKIAKTSKTEKIIPANCEFIDIAGIVKGASQGEGLGNKFLANIREVSVILQVVRVFENHDITHVNGNIDPKSDIEIINSELILADIETLEKRIISNARKARGDKEAEEAQKVFEQMLEWLNKGNLAISLELTEEKREYLKDLHLLTNKQFVYVANVNEDMMDTPESELRNILGITDKNIPICPICAKLEADMIDMSNIERKAFLEEMGLITTGIDNLIKTAYDALGLQYYFTSGEKETRAWTIHAGDKAPQAAGVIHTDFEKGFIKADVVNWEDFVNYGGWPQAREAGKVKLEGKDYIVQDGDIMIFKFNN
nr:redox-regulated ATPase YchF [Candidatus Gracilibacteria bacterium]